MRFAIIYMNYSLGVQKNKTIILLVILLLVFAGIATMIAVNFEFLR